MKLYKLTDENNRTYGGCQWGKNVTVETDGEGGLCGPGFTHFYTDPLLAVFLNPIYRNFDLTTAHLWECEGTVAKKDRGLKVGCTRGTTIRRIPLPEVTLEQRVRFGILCAQEIPQPNAWNDWAEGWLSGKDRNGEATWAAAGAAAKAAADTAAWAAAKAAAWAADAAAEAAWAAARAAAKAAEKGKTINLIDIARRATMAQAAIAKMERKEE